MLFETLWLLPVAAIYLFGIADSPTSHMGENPWSLNLLLMAAGVVTTIPLLCFTGAATRLRLHAGIFPVYRPDADVPAGGNLLRRSAGRG